MDWREEYQRKLVTPEQAVRVVKSGDFVQLAWSAAEPTTVARALEKRREELRDVVIDETIGITPFGWFEDGWGESFRPRTLFVSTWDREGWAKGTVAFYPSTPFLATKAATECNRYYATRPPEVFMIRTTPPDKNGFCHFGHMSWYSNLAARYAKKIIAQVDDNLIRARGVGHIHVSKVDYFVESPPDDRFNRDNPGGRMPRPQRTDEELAFIEVIGAQVATLVKDGDTIFFGGGTFSYPTVEYFGEKVDLAIHSETMPPAAIDMVKAGVINGKRRKLHPGVAVVATVLGGRNGQDFEYMDDNPLFELHGMEYSNSIWAYMQYEPFISINNVLLMDLTGQMTCEAIGLQQRSATGGQWEAVLSAMSSRGGRSIHVLSSFYRFKDGTKASRIVPRLPDGTPVSVPRTFVDYVVTENGIVNLQGKSLRERADALISIADPDFQGELRKEAHKLWLK